MSMLKGKIIRQMVNVNHELIVIASMHYIFIHSKNGFVVARQMLGTWCLSPTTKPTITDGIECMKSQLNTFFIMSQFIELSVCVYVFIDLMKRKRRGRVIGLEMGVACKWLGWKSKYHRCKKNVSLLGEIQMTPTSCHWHKGLLTRI